MVYATFGSLPTTIKRGSALFHLHSDHLGSSSLTTDSAGAATANRADYAYGAERSATGDLQTDHTFTGQKRDSTGLMYYNARYYDPALGTFVSPDSMVPGAGQVINYNRFLYARGNPFKYTDPSGYIPDKPTGPPPGVDKWVVDWYWNNRWYLAHAHGRGDGHWNVPITAEFLDKEILTDVLGKAGIEIDSAWKDLDPEYEDLSRLGQGVVKLAQKVGKLADTGTTAGLARLKTLAGGEVTWFRANVGGPGTTSLCTSDRITAQTPACARGARIEFYNVLFGSKDDALVGGTAVHELAHVINSQYCVPIVGSSCTEAKLFFPGWNTKTNLPFVALTAYAKKGRGEYWAEALAVWAYDSDYKKAKLLYSLQEIAIEWDNARVNTITDLLRRCALMSIFLLTLSGCQVPLSDWPQPTLAVAGPPESFPCSIFDESQWQEFRFGLDSPADVVAIVARSRVKNKERIWTDSLKHGLETVDWHEFGDELNVHYRAWFRKEQGLFRVMGYWAPNPTMEQVLDCLGFPDYYKAIYAANIEAIQLSLTLWYTERGIIVEHVSFYYQEQLPTIDADYGDWSIFFRCSRGA